MAIVENIQNGEQKSIYRINPDVSIDVDYNHRTINIEMALPGVAKKDILLKILPTWFHIQARREDIEYSGSYNFGTIVVPEKTTAKYSNGLLKIQAHIKNPLDDAKLIEFK